MAVGCGYNCCCTLSVCMLEHRSFFFSLPEYAKEKSFSFSKKKNLFIPKVGISSSRTAHPTMIYINIHTHTYP